jgi:hypothetical protein
MSDRSAAAISITSMGTSYHVSPGAVATQGTALYLSPVGTVRLYQPPPPDLISVLCVNRR